MTRDEMIEHLADYFGLEYPEETDDDGHYRIRNEYYWQTGAYLKDSIFLSLGDVVSALEDYCDED